ncbi:amino acid ABC transporter permease [Leekyejoonella antrihumi]|uniref:Amino acid ABC transporter permease n=1 Tax=Leekyejoonella antrihumi TaxID=1660198 RepID=A0A563E8I2_9MICO|nr:amino acid ABC transporter permease [Leekyejoonella antrihumi]TWP38511.1 amino acid ABC transporter permease [Leekyejoonella antrihumi]
MTTLQKPLNRPGQPTQPLGAATRLTGAATLVAVAVLAVVVWTAVQLYLVAPDSGGWRWVLIAIAILGVIGALAPFSPARNAFQSRSAAVRAVADGDGPAIRKYRSRMRNSAWVCLGGCLTVLVLCAFVLFLLANNHAVQRTFFQPAMISRSWFEVTKAFGRNIFIAVVAEIIVLVWGLVLALARLAPGRAGRSIASLATAYIDAFRAVPAIIVIYLVGFGLPLAHFPVLSSLSPTGAAILALSLTYGAYVAEVYRAGIESVHWSQPAAARSLGLSHGLSMRYVVVPQAVRRVIPPLLNDFIGLQKDTALVTVIGTVDGFTQAKIYSSNYFNLSSVTVVAALFVIVTIPQTRFVDRLLARDQRRMSR